MEPKCIPGSSAIEYNVQAFARPCLSKNKIYMASLKHRAMKEIDFIKTYLKCGTALSV